MQLKPKQANNAKITNRQLAAQRPKTSDISSVLAAATCALLAAVPGYADAEGSPGEWDFDVAGLLYTESDDRVMAVEPVFSATRNFEEGEALNFKVTLDMLTGASPNGATPSESPQTFTRPSGSSDYVVSAGEAPLDDTFKDTRVALSSTWSAPINRNWSYSAGVYGSSEYDYFSFGLNGGLTRYLNEKNTVLNLGVSIEQDEIDPVGGAPVPLAEMPHRTSLSFDADQRAAKSSSDSKTLTDLIVGVTQIVDERTIMQFNYGLGVADGYLNDPYKMLSVIDDSPGANFGGNVLDGNGNSIYLYESRPDSRTKHSFYWQAKHALESGDVIDLSYRFMFDDWGVNSHTLEASYQWRFTESYIEPFVRYYTQSEADFYKRFLNASEYNGGSPTVTEASADYRLGQMDTYTLGAKYGFRLGGNEANVRLSYYMQSNDGEQGFGKLASQDLYPTTSATILTFGYSF